MAGISTSRTRKDLQFMAEDIGPELVPFLQLEDVLKGLNAEKQRQLLSLFSPQQILASLTSEERLSDVSMEELIKSLPPEQRKKLFEVVLRQVASGLADSGKANGKGAGH